MFMLQLVHLMTCLEQLMAHLDMQATMFPATYQHFLAGDSNEELSRLSLTLVHIISTTSLSVDGNPQGLS